MLTVSVAFEASKGPRWVCRGPLGLSSADNSGLECNYESYCWGWAQRVWMTGRVEVEAEAVGGPRLEKESRNGGRKPGPVAKDREVCWGVGGLSGL